MNRTKIKNLAMGAVMTAVMCILAPISIPIKPVPISLGVFSAFLTGLLLPGHYAVISVLAYVGIALLGLPVCAGYTGGPAIVLGPTGGYIAGFFFIAFMSSVGIRSRRRVTLCVSMLAGLFMCYLFGTVWYMALTKTALKAAIMACVAPFVPLDIAKGAAALAFRAVLEKTPVLKNSK